MTSALLGRLQGSYRYRTNSKRRGRSAAGVVAQLTPFVVIPKVEIPAGQGGDRSPRSLSSLVSRRQEGR